MAVSIRAKFKVRVIERTMGTRAVDSDDGKSRTYVACEIRTVTFAPVYGDSEENKKFWNSSPSGEIKLGCVNLAAADAFELDKEYYVDFTPAPSPVDG